MARTIKGNLTGRARVTELRELREGWEESYLKEQRRKREEERAFQHEKFLAEERDRLAREIIAENDGMLRCIVLEGERSFYRWGNPLGGVPRGERVRLLEERIKRLDPTPTLPSPYKGEGEDGKGLCVGNHADTLHPVPESV